jgi:hypothetical protein
MPSDNLRVSIKLEFAHPFLWIFQPCLLRNSTGGAGIVTGYH